MKKEKTILATKHYLMALLTFCVLYIENVVSVAMPSLNTGLMNESSLRQTEHVEMDLK